MESAKEDVLGVKYNKSKDYFEVKDKSNKLKVFLRRHKFILSIITTTTILMVINVIMIGKFFNLLLML